MHAIHHDKTSRTHMEGSACRSGACQHHAFLAHFVVFLLPFGFFQHKISPVEPGEYSERFFSFLKAVMRDGEGGERFRAD